MEYRKFGNDYIVRIDRGEEILESLAKVCNAEHILLGTLTGLGAVGEVTLGVFNRDIFAYEKKDFVGDMEIASCSGNISTMDGQNYLHVHMTVGNPMTGLCQGGHLNRAVVSLTGEFHIHAIQGEVDRKYSDQVGLNLYRFL